jgi:hypothetical protein
MTMDKTSRTCNRRFKLEALWLWRMTGRSGAACERERGQRGMGYERLDQLANEFLLGVR